MKNFKELSVVDLKENIFTLINKEWMLVTAGTAGDCNTMTASWGGMGVLWNKPVAFIFIRPQRYTLSFIEKRDSLTLSFFAPEYHKSLNYCGAHSGKDENKIANAGLHITTTPDGNATLEEARMVLECEKLYANFIDPKLFLDKSIIENFYPDKDFHKMFIISIDKIWLKDPITA